MVAAIVLGLLIWTKSILSYCEMIRLYNCGIDYRGVAGCGWSLNHSALSSSSPAASVAAMIIDRT